MSATSPNFQAAVFVVAVAGLATNVAFFDQQGPVFVKSTAVPIWLTLLLSLNSFPSGSSSSKGTGTARRVLSRINVFLSFFLLVCFLLSRIANAWPWALLLTVLLTFEARGQHQRTVLNQQSCLPLSETQQHQRLPQSLSETLLPDSNSQPTPHHPHEGNNKGIIGQESCVEEAKENKKKNPVASTTATTTTTTRSSSLGPLAKDVFSLVLLALLSLGGAVQLNWSLRYMYSPEARGMQRSDVVLGNGRTLSLYWHCEGGYDGDGSDSGSSSGISSSNNGAVGGGGSASSRASNTRGSNSSNSGSVVTHMLNADASHGAADLWPLQRELTVRGLRSCVFDKPGQGWADNYAPDQAMDFSTTAMALLFEAMKEPAPYRLVGWGGGAADMYSYAKNRPGDVEGLVFLDAYSDAVEWRSWAYGNGASVEEMMDYRASDLASRKTSFTLIRLALVPFGLSPLLFRPDPSSYALPELFDVYRYFYWLDKTWNTQWFALRSDMVRQGGLLQLGFLDYHGDFDLRDTRLEGLPLLHVMSKPKEEGGTDDDTDDNDTEIDDNDDGDVAAREKAFGFQDRLFTANVTGNPSLAFCTFMDCDLGFPLRYPEVAADAILERFGL